MRSAGMIWVTPPMLRIISGSPCLMSTPWIVRPSLVFSSVPSYPNAISELGVTIAVATTAADLPRPQPSSAGPSSAPVPLIVWHIRQRAAVSLPRAALPVSFAISSTDSTGRSAGAGGVTISFSVIDSGS